MSHFPLLCLALLLTSCAVGPDYVKPSVEIPKTFKEGDTAWKPATPQDDIDRGPWWQLFNDPMLDSLEKQLNISNQNIAVAEAQYRQALALVTQSQAGFFPTISGSATTTRQQESLYATPTSSLAHRPKPYTTYSPSLQSSWELDLWGSIRRQLEASEAGAEAALAGIESARLSAQSSLAQSYFNLRTLDNLQKVLDSTVEATQELLTLAINLFNMGINSQLEVQQARNQLEIAQTQARDNGINRAQYEHAIAVLIGRSPSTFSLPPQPTSLIPPAIPTSFPSTLLERRPDIAQSERLVAQANADVGAAKAAYFPTLTLTGSTGYASTIFSKLFSVPAQIWSLGPKLAATLFDGGLLEGKEDAVIASYEQSVATYRQTVLAAFQAVEDNLAALRILSQEFENQKAAVQSLETVLKLTREKYKAGTVAFSSVITVQMNLYTAKQALITLSGRQMIATVNLVTALGGSP